MDRPLSLRPEPSRIALGYAATVLVLAALALWLADLPWALRLLLSAALAWLSVRSWRTWRQPVVTGLDWSAGCWTLSGRGALGEVALLQPVFMAFGLVSLGFRLPTGRTVRLLLWPDSASAEDLRRLRCILLQR
jgi:hypothetical protein